MRNNTAVTSEDLERLPARFRLHIAQLTNRVQELERAQAAQQETRVIVDPYGAKSYVDDDTEVRFMVRAKETKYPDRMVGLDCALRGAFVNSRKVEHAMLNVSCPSGTLMVVPGAANQIYVGVAPR